MFEALEGALRGLKREHRDRAWLAYHAGFWAQPFGRDRPTWAEVDPERPPPAPLSPAQLIAIQMAAARRWKKRHANKTREPGSQA